jgi:predicted RNA methylase
VNASTLVICRSPYMSWVVVDATVSGWFGTEAGCGVLSLGFIAIAPNSAVAVAADDASAI